MAAKTIAALDAKLEDAVKTWNTEIGAVTAKIEALAVSLPETINKSISEALAGSLAAFQTTVQQSQHSIQQSVQELKTEFLEKVRKVHDDVQTVSHRLAEVKSMAVKASQDAQNALLATRKHAAAAVQPQPSLIRELKERIANEPNLILSPISDTIPEQNLAAHIVQIVNHHTNLALTPADIVDVKRLGRGGSQFKGVRVSFSSSSTRNRLFYERRHFGKQQGDDPAVFLNPDLTRSQQEHKRRMVPLFKHIRDTNRNTGVQGKTPFFDEELLFHYPGPNARSAIAHAANFDEHALAAAMPAVPSTSAAAT
jgi:hypothetical protein